MFVRVAVSRESALKCSPLAPPRRIWNAVGLQAGMEVRKNSHLVTSSASSREIVPTPLFE